MFLLFLLAVYFIRCKNSPMAAVESLPEVSKDMIFLHDQACKLIEVSQFVSFFFKL